MSLKYQELLEITLESNGYDVWQAKTGNEGIIMAANHPQSISPILDYLIRVVMKF